MTSATKADAIEATGGKLVEFIGSFENTTGELVVSDPCYGPEAIGAKAPPSADIVSQARRGTWDAFTVRNDANGRIRSLVAVARGYVAPNLDDSTFWVSVDSGQAGIFDKASFRNESVVPSDQVPFHLTDDPWYDMCCARTNTASAGGVIPGGVVTVSGMGDGEYEVYCTHDNEDAYLEVTGVQIVFIRDE